MTGKDIAKQVFTPKALGWWQYGLSLAGGAALLWTYSGWIVSSAAEEVFKKMLEENPAFIDLKNQITEQTEAVEEIQEQQKKTETTLSDLADETKDTGEAVGKLDGKLDDLMKVLIRPSRTGLNIEAMPAFPAGGDQ